MLEIEHIIITQKDIDNALERPSDFGYFGSNKELFKTWSLGPGIEHRDSDVLQRSNASVLERELKEVEEKGIIESESYEIFECSHWACGWVKHLSFKALDENEKPTNIFKFIMAWYEMLDDYPVADEDDYSEKEIEENYENSLLEIGWQAENLSDSLPDDWKEQVYNNLSDKEIYYEEENYSKENINQAVKELGFNEEERKSEE